MAEGVESGDQRNRMRWLEETNAMAEGDKCYGRRRRMQWLEETHSENL